MKKRELSLAFLTQGIQYLSLAEAVFEENIKKENKHVLFTFNKKDLDSYDEVTKWSDFNIILPTLFVYYHGLELVMKGLVILLSGEMKTVHKITELSEALKKFPEISEISEILNGYVVVTELQKTPIGTWLSKNNLDINQLYELLRYPTDRMQKVTVSNLPLTYQGKKLLPFIKKIIEDSKKIRIFTVSFYRNSKVKGA